MTKKPLTVLQPQRGQLMTSAVIETLGGIQAVADLLGGLAYNRVANWNHQHTFPANTMLALEAALAAKGLRVPDPVYLWGQTPVAARA
jgi:hypothetical protein